jgi:hypothetical protein
MVNTSVNATGVGTMNLRKAISNLTHVEKELLRNWLRNSESALSFPPNHSPAAAFLLEWQKGSELELGCRKVMAALLLSTIIQEPVLVKWSRITSDPSTLKASITVEVHEVVPSLLDILK